jgi:hypothetical protein
LVTGDQSSEPPWPLGSSLPPPPLPDPELPEPLSEPDPELPKPLFVEVSPDPEPSEPLDVESSEPDPPEPEPSVEPDVQVGSLTCSGSLQRSVPLVEVAVGEGVSFESEPLWSPPPFSYLPSLRFRAGRA